LRHEDSVQGAVFNADESRILTWSDDGTGPFVDGTARLWDVSALPRGNLINITCGLLPDYETSELRGRYGIQVAEPICGSETPAPIWAELED
jgi:hypothetical protein